MTKKFDISHLYCFYSTHYYNNDKRFHLGFLGIYEDLKDEVIIPGSDLWVKIIFKMYDKWLLGLEFIDLDHEFLIVNFRPNMPGQFTLMWGFRLLLFAKLFPEIQMDYNNLEYYDWGVQSELMYNGILKLKEYVDNRKKKKGIGLLYCLTKLHIIRRRVAERIYAPGGSGFLSAQTNFLDFKGKIYTLGFDKI